jgi:hypothetical protein
MKKANNNFFSKPVKVFQGRRLPEEAILVGYSALLHAYNLNVPIPRILYAIGKQHKKFEQDKWHILTPRYAPSPTLEGHLTFALKYEGLDLALLKRLFETVSSSTIEAMIKEKITGSYARRIWFLYEWLTGKKLDLADADRGNYIPVVNPELQYCIEGKNSPRHRVRNNLPGTSNFCPLVFKTEKIEKFISMKLSQKAKNIMDKIPADLLARSASFFLLEDSRSSYMIEGEKPPATRVERWAKVIGEAGRRELDVEELIRLQKILIGDTRFVRVGFRDQGGFVGQHDRRTRRPLPEHISAKAEDLSSLIKGVIFFNNKSSKELDSVIASAVLAFGVVFIHPFEDGNGRIHRYLIHHVLSKRGFNPPGMVFPISSTILDKIEDYREVLQDYSKRLLPVIEWRAASDGNVIVLNDTADFYRFFDCTPCVEFLYECVEKTIEEDLPAEATFLKNYDRFCERINRIVDMPNRTLNLLFHFLHQNKGKISKRASNKEFAKFTKKEKKQIEEAYSEIFSQKP